MSRLSCWMWEPRAASANESTLPLVASLGQVAGPPESDASSLPLPGQVVKGKPNDKDAKMKYQECSKIVKQKAFERAIAGDEHRRSVVDSLDIESMSE